MSNRLPQHPNIEQLRATAKDLQRAVNRGEQSALDRVFTVYPYFGGDAQQPFEPARFSLRSAQHILARELGFQSWQSLVEQAETGTEEPPRPRWHEQAVTDTAHRAMQKAYHLGHASVALPHFLLALLDPPEPGPAYEVLTELGANYEQVLRIIEAWDLGPATRGHTTSSPVYHLIEGWARGLALASNATAVTDEHTLLALTYGITRYECTDVERLGLDPDQIYDTLKRRGVEVPKVRPPFGPTRASRGDHLSTTRDPSTTPSSGQ